jgi:hypothetical protein
MFGIPDAHPKDRGWVLMPRQCGRPGADLASRGAVARYKLGPEMAVSACHHP